MPGNDLQHFAKSVTALTSGAVQGQGLAPGGVLGPGTSVMVPVLLPRLLTTDLTLTPLPQDFTQITADALGDHVTPADGWDTDIADPIAAYNEDIGTIVDLQQHVVDADFIEGQFTGDTYTPVVQSLATFSDAGDKLLSDFDAVFLPPDNPPPPPPPPPGTPPPPPDPGGGGGPCMDCPPPIPPDCDPNQDPSACPIF
jgi:hypothetical protein